MHANEVGSITSVSDSAGTTRSVNTYDPYGTRSTSNSTYASRFGFTGHAFLPEIGLHYFKARMYSASFGRFMQTDPIGYADGVNWYAYAQNDPINRSDPLGLNGIEGLSDFRTAGSNHSGLDEIIVRGCGLACARAQTLTDAFIKRLIQILPALPTPFQKKAGCPNVPVAPPGVDVNANIKEAGSRNLAKVPLVSTQLGRMPNPSAISGPFWFYQQVDYGGNWDYKTQNTATADYTDFGNFNYGATGRALGFSPDTLLWAAGMAQLKHDLGSGQVSGTLETRFDDPADPALIEAGINYHDNGCR